MSYLEQIANDLGIDPSRVEAVLGSLGVVPEDTKRAYEDAPRLATYVSRPSALKAVKNSGYLSSVGPWNDPYAKKRRGYLPDRWRLNKPVMDKIMRTARRNPFVPLNSGITRSFKLGEILGNAPLYKHYPELKDIPVYVLNSGIRNYGGYSPNKNVMYINPWASGFSYDNLLETLAHETQHATQKLDNVPGGASYKKEREEVGSRVNLNPGSDFTGKLIKSLRNLSKDAPLSKYLDVGGYSRYAANSGEAEARVTGDRALPRTKLGIYPSRRKNIYLDIKQRERWRPLLRAIGSSSSSASSDALHNLDRAAKRVGIK